MSEWATHVRMGNARPNDTLRLADYDRISLLIDLYFPRLFSTFRQYTSAIDSFLIAEGNVRRDAKGFVEHRKHRTKVESGGSGFVPQKQTCEHYLRLFRIMISIAARFRRKLESRCHKPQPKREEPTRKKPQPPDLVYKLAREYVHRSRRGRRDDNGSTWRSERRTKVHVLWIAEPQLCRHNSLDSL